MSVIPNVSLGATYQLFRHDVHVRVTFYQVRVAVSLLHYTKHSLQQPVLYFFTQYFMPTVLPRAM